MVPLAPAQRLPRGAVRRRPVLKAASLRRGPDRGRGLQAAAARRQRRPLGWPRCPWWAGGRGWGRAEPGPAAPGRLLTLSAPPPPPSPNLARAAACRCACACATHSPLSCTRPSPPPPRALPPAREDAYPRASCWVAGKQPSAPAHAPSEADVSRVCYLEPSGIWSPAGFGGSVPPNQDGWAQTSRQSRGVSPCPALPWSQWRFLLQGTQAWGLSFRYLSVQLASFVGTGLREGPPESGLKVCLGVGKANEQSIQRRKVTQGLR